MRGKLTNVFDNWFVKYEVAVQSKVERRILPLHPDDAIRFGIMGNLPNNQHIMQDKDCFFQIIELEEDQNSVGDIIHRDYAKLSSDTVYLNPVMVGHTDEKVKILIDALNDIKNWDDELEDEWDDCGYRAKAALDKFNNK